MLYSTLQQWLAKAPRDFGRPPPKGLLPCHQIQCPTTHRRHSRGNGKARPRNNWRDAPYFIRAGSGTDWQAVISKSQKRPTGFTRVLCHGDFDTGHARQRRTNKTQSAPIPLCSKLRHSLLLHSASTSLWTFPARGPHSLRTTEKLLNCTYQPQLCSKRGALD